AARAALVPVLRLGGDDARAVAGAGADRGGAAAGSTHGGQWHGARCAVVAAGRAHLASAVAVLEGAAAVLWPTGLHRTDRPQLGRRRAVLQRDDADRGAGTGALGPGPPAG